MNILVGSITKILHGQIKLDRIVCRAVQLQPILGSQEEVIKGVEGVQHCCGWFWSRVVVDEPASDVPIETVRYGVE